MRKNAFGLYFFTEKLFVYNHSTYFCVKVSKKIIHRKIFAMGAEKPDLWKPQPVTKTDTLPHFKVVAVVLTGVALFVQIYFSGEEEAARLSPHEDARLQKRLKEIDEAEQYALIAKDNGWYNCLHSARTMHYLLTGEVWKYGVTTKGEMGRYTAVFLLKNNLIYLTQFRGNVAECLKQEQIKLFCYPYLRENMARPPEARLPRPPGNPIMR